MNRLGSALGPLAEGFRLRRASSTTLDVLPPTADDGAVVITIDGKIRYRETPLPPRAHPGGAAGTYDVFAVALDDDVVNAPAPNTDNTVYDFDLRIVAAGGTPAIVPGTVEIHRFVGQCGWDGTAITWLRQDVDFVVGAQLADGALSSTAQVTVTRQPGGALAPSLPDPLPLGAGGATLGGDTSIYRAAANELGFGLGGVERMRLAAGQLRLPVQGSTGGVLLGGDAQLYRDAANRVRTPGDFYADGDVRARNGASTQVAIGAVGFGATAGLVFGLAADADIHRSGVGQIATTGLFNAQGDVWARGGAAAQVAAGAQGPLAQAGFTLGAFQDTNLYRSALDTLKTDDRLDVGGLLNAYGSVNVDSSGVSGKVFFGALSDTNLYRSAADTLKTDDDFVAAATITAKAGSANQVSLGWTGAGAGPGLSLGSTLDTNLYRSGANELATDDAFRALGSVSAGYGTVLQTQLAADGSTGVVMGVLQDVRVYRFASTTPVLRTESPFTLKTVTTAGRPPAGNVPDGSIIYVTDGAAGSRLQMTHAAAWIGIG